MVIIAVDESGDFAAGSNDRHWHVAVALREGPDGSALARIEERFRAWERTIPGAKKNHRGEIKGVVLDASELDRFVGDVLEPDPAVGVIARCMVPAQNPPRVIEAHKVLPLAGLNAAIIHFGGTGNATMETHHRELSHWFRNLGPDQFLKLHQLAACLDDAFRCTIGRAYVGGFDDELVGIRFVIDRSFVKEGSQLRYWQDLLRNQLRARSDKEPVGVPEEWYANGHPFVKAFERDGVLEPGAIWRDQTAFVRSDERFEVRIADVVASIFRRHYSREPMLPIMRRVWAQSWYPVRRIAGGGWIPTPCRQSVLSDVDPMSVIAAFTQSPI